MNLVDIYCNTPCQKLLKYDQIAKKLSTSKMIDFRVEHKINTDYNNTRFWNNTYTSSSDILSTNMYIKH